MSKLDSKIKKIIQNEGFTNDEIFYADYDSFEEIPLFSRWKSIAFLKKTPFDENNKLLILHAVKLAEHAREIAFINTKEDVHKDFFLLCNANEMGLHRRNKLHYSKYLYNKKTKMAFHICET